jgi:hypothetical protein
MKEIQAGSYSDHSQGREDLHGSILFRRQRKEKIQADPVSGEVGEMMFESECDQHLSYHHPPN